VGRVYCLSDLQWFRSKSLANMRLHLLFGDMYMYSGSYNYKHNDMYMYSCSYNYEHNDNIRCRFFFFVFTC